MSRSFAQIHAGVYCLFTLAHGLPEEDELYESLIQHTNRVYEVTTDQLVPCVAHWGTILRKSMLRSDKVSVILLSVLHTHVHTRTHIYVQLLFLSFSLFRRLYALLQALLTISKHPYARKPEQFNLSSEHNLTIFSPVSGSQLGKYIS